MIHCIGDSHVSVFSGQDPIVPFFPPKHDEDRTRYFRTYRSFTPTAYNFINHLDRILHALSDKDKDNDYALIVAGEIDCRFHLPRKIATNNLSIDEVVNECVDRFTQVFIELINKGWRCIAWGPCASTWETFHPELPIHGDMVHRNIITKKFNDKLYENAKSINIPFLSMFPKLINENNETIREYYMDMLHLKSIKMIDIIIEEFKKANLIQ
jgi:hypothetical protein